MKLVNNQLPAEPSVSCIGTNWQTRRIIEFGHVHYDLGVPRFDIPRCEGDKEFDVNLTWEILQDYGGAHHMHDGLHARLPAPDRLRGRSTDPIF